MPNDQNVYESRNRPSNRIMNSNENIEDQNEIMFKMLDNLRMDLARELYSPEKIAHFDKEQRDDLLIWMEDIDQEIDGRGAIVLAEAQSNVIKNKPVLGIQKFKLHDIKKTPGIELFVKDDEPDPREIRM